MPPTATPQLQEMPETPRAPPIHTPPPSQRFDQALMSKRDPKLPNGRAGGISPVGGVAGAQLCRGRARVSPLPGTDEAARDRQGPHQHRPLPCRGGRADRGAGPLAQPRSAVGWPPSKDKRAKQRNAVLPDDVNIHDIRRTVADALLNRIGAPPWIVDHVVLGHARPKLLRTYMPTLPLGEAREALQKWGEELDRVLGVAVNAQGPDAAVRVGLS